MADLVRHRLQHGNFVGDVSMHLNNHALKVGVSIVVYGKRSGLGLLPINRHWIFAIDLNRVRRAGDWCRVGRESVDYTSVALIVLPVPERLLDTSPLFCIEHRGDVDSHNIILRPSKSLSQCRGARQAIGTSSLRVNAVREVRQDNCLGGMQREVRRCIAVVFDLFSLAQPSLLRRCL